MHPAAEAPGRHDCNSRRRIETRRGEALLLVGAAAHKSVELDARVREERELAGSGHQNARVACALECSSVARREVAGVSAAKLVPGELVGTPRRMAFHRSR